MENENEVKKFDFKAFFHKYIITPSFLCTVILVLSACVWMLDDSYLGYGSTYFLSLIILQLLIIALPAVFYVKIRGDKFNSALPLKLVRPNGIWYTVVSILTVVTGVAVIRMISGFAGYTESLLGSYSTIANESMNDITGVISSVVTFVLIPSICEEFVFRGVILTELSGISKISAVLMSSLLWSFIKFNPRAFVIYFFAGVVMACAVLLTKSILSSVVIHLALNYSVMMFEKYLLKIVNQNEYTVILVFILVALFLISLFLLFAEGERHFHNEALSLVPESEAKKIRAEQKKKRKEEKEKPSEEKIILRREKIKGELKNFSEILISPTFIICLVLFVLGSIFKK